MKKNFLLLVALLFSMSFIVGCSDDETTPAIDYAKDIVGTYDGDIDIAVPGLPEVNEPQKIVMTYASFNKVTMALNDFSFPMGENVVQVGNIVVKDIPVSPSAGNTLRFVSTTEYLDLTVGRVKVEVNGTLNGKDIDLTINVSEVIAVETVTVKFTGKKLEGDDITDYAKNVVGTYKGDINIVIPQLPEVTELQKIVLSYAAHNKVNMALNNFSFPMGENNIKLGNIVVKNIPVEKALGSTAVHFISTSEYLDLEVGRVKVEVSGTVDGKNINLKIDVSEVAAVETVAVTFTGVKMDNDNESTEAIVSSFSVDAAITTAKAVITHPTAQNNGSVVFYISDLTKANVLTTLAPVITVSNGAIISPASEVASDFTNTVTYTVTAQDGITKAKYDVSFAKGKYDFENWVAMLNKEGVVIPNSYEPAGWGSSNTGAIYIQLLKEGFKGLSVVESDESRSGKSVKIETFNTTVTTTSIGNLVPVVTTGTLFLGTFITNIMNTLQSTKFGVPYASKPVKFTGWYKYTPGEDYYVATKKNGSTAEINNAITDSCSIVAVLFEIAKDTDILTGVNLHTSDKVVMKAKLADGSKKEAWTKFDLNFVAVEGKTYDPTKSYKIAIVCSSSHKGDTFSGAPGSTLLVDDFEIISE